MAARSRQGGARGGGTHAAELARVRALAHPLRLRLIESFAGGPRTTQQVAEALRQPPTRLYHHVYTLERAGLLRLVRTQPKRGTVEKYFELVTPLIGAGGAATPRPGRLRQARASLAMTVLDATRRELVQALGPGARGLAQGAAAPHGLMLARLVVPGSAADVTRLRRRLLAVVREHAREAGRRAGRRAPTGRSEAPEWTLTVALLPRPKRRG